MIPFTASVPPLFARLVVKYARSAARQRRRATPARTVKQIVRLQWRRRLGPAQISEELGIPASTVHAVLVREESPGSTAEVAR